MGRSKALHEITENLFGVRSTPIENRLTTTIAATATRLVPDDPKRVGLVVANLSLNAMYIGLTPLVSASNGIYVAPSGGSISLTWDKDFELTSHEWYAIAAVAGSAVYSLENILE